jgi:aminotransferase in exopolysaccharide biosynthesis
MQETFQKTVEFIRELYQKPEGFIALHEPVFNGNEKKYLEECIDTTYVSSIGKFVDKFEIDIAAFTGANKAVVCVNGTNAIHLALKLVGVEQGTEVITQPLTFIATANAISYCGAVPVFLEVDMDTMGLSPKALLQFLETETYFDPVTDKRYNKTTKRVISACVPMHTFGHPCRIDEIVEICDQFQIPVVEDAAESLGSYYKLKHTGTFGKIGVLSFNGNKIITTGGGGMLLFQDEALAKRAKHLTTQAKIPHAWEFAHDEIGYNYRMPNINAALGVAQLEQIETFLSSKRVIAGKYKKFFDATDFQFVTEPANALSNYWLNCILLPNKKERDIFLKYMNENGIMTRPAWQLMNELTMFKDCQAFELKNATAIADTLVNIPSSAFNGN